MPPEANFNNYFSDASSGSFERITFVRIPRIRAQATVRISTLPKLTTIPPTPVIKITLATKGFCFY